MLNNNNNNNNNEKKMRFTGEFVLNDYALEKTNCRPTSLIQT